MCKKKIKFVFHVEASFSVVNLIISPLIQTFINCFQGCFMYRKTGCLLFFSYANFPLTGH